MKKLIIFCVVVGLLSITNYAVANPTYSQTEDIDIWLDATIWPDFSVPPHTYTHTYGGSVDPLVDGPLIGSATLTIVAEDIRGIGFGVPPDGEQDPVSLSFDGGTNWIPLGLLLPDDIVTGVSTTVFDLGAYLSSDLEGGATLTVKVEIEDYFKSYLKTSDLVIVSAIPAPGAILLGSLGVGLVGWLRRRRTL